MDHTSTLTGMTRHLVERRVFEEHPFTLLDVGCSGGISSMWRLFEPSLVALGVDPLVSECERLNANETNQCIHYRAAFVGLPPDHPFVVKRGNKGPWGGNPWNRLSASWAIDVLSSRAKETDRLPILNEWPNLDLSDPKRRIGVDVLVTEENLREPDFIKVDVDGFDIDVVLSAQECTRTSPVLGYMLEVNYFGSASDTDHTFHNTDRLMRQWGFDLFALSVRRYSASALPAGFEWDGPGQTVFGRPYQGDALYLRDPLADANDNRPLLTVHKILKLACLFECFGLPDHAAELIKVNEPAITAFCSATELLDILAKEVDPSVRGYSEYMEKFRADPTAFYRSKRT